MNPGSWRGLLAASAIALCAAAPVPAGTGCTPEWRDLAPVTRGRELAAVAHLPGVGWLTAGRGARVLVAESAGAWHEELVPVDGDIQSLAAGSASAIALGSNPAGVAEVALRTTVGWEIAATFPGVEVSWLGWLGDSFAVLGFRAESGRGVVFLSGDGRTWQEQPMAVGFHPAAAAGTGRDLTVVGREPGVGGVGIFGAIYRRAGETRFDRSWYDSRFAFQAVAWTGSLFVTLGNGGAILSSPDGWMWTLRATVANPLSAIAAGDGVFVAVGEPDAGGQMVVTSSGGVHWSANGPTTPVAGDRLAAVAWDGEGFVAVGAAGQFWTSGDGVNWGVTVGRWDPAFRGFAASPARIVAVGGNGAVTSRDGVTFRSGSVETFLNAVAWDGRTFVAVGDGIWTSSNGERWQARTDWGRIGGVVCSDLAWTGVRFIAACQQALSGWFATSSDGAAWTSGATGNPIDALIWTGSEAVALRGGRILSSVDGVDWVDGGPLPATMGREMIQAFAGNGRRLVAVTVSIDYDLQPPVVGRHLWVADDARSWRRIDVADPALIPDGLHWDGTRFLGVGRAGLIAVSADGEVWERLPSPTTADLAVIAGARDGYLAAGSDGTLLRGDCAGPARVRRHLATTPGGAPAQKAQP